MPTSNEIPQPIDAMLTALLIVRIRRLFSSSTFQSTRMYWAVFSALMLFRRTRSLLRLFPTFTTGKSLTTSSATSWGEPSRDTAKRGKRPSYSRLNLFTDFCTLRADGDWSFSSSSARTSILNRASSLSSTMRAIEASNLSDPLL